MKVTDEREVVRQHHRQHRASLQPAGRLYEVRRQFMLQHVSESDVVLDAGCGNGVYTVSLAAHAQKVCGVDFTVELLNDLQAHLTELRLTNVQLVQADLRQLPFPDNCFDSVVCYSTLYYVRELDVVLKEFSRVLRKGGRAIFDHGNLNSLEARHSVRAYSIPHYFVSVQKAAQFIKDAGLRIVQLRRLQIYRPLRGHPVERWLAQLLERPVGGTMLDEFVSSLPLLRCFAFRLLFACEK